MDTIDTAPATAPRLSLLTGIETEPHETVQDTIRSVTRQTSDDWQWIVAVPPDSSWAAPFAELAAQDRRVVLVESGDDLLNAALAEATGEFMAVVFAGDRLAREATRYVLEAADKGDEPVDVLYTDHEWISAEGDRHDRDLKPDWSPERLRHHHYLGQLTVHRRDLVTRVGGFRPELRGAVHHDLALRVTELAGSVVHVRRVLYLVRDRDLTAAPWALEHPFEESAAVRAVQEHLDRVGVRATAVPGAAGGLVQVRREPDRTTSVSIIIPTIGTKEVVGGAMRTMVTETIRSVAQRSQHQDVEYVVVYDKPTPDEVLDELRGLRDELGLRLKLIVFTAAFNFSAKCNYGAGFADGEVLVFLNDDMEAITEDLVESLIAPLAEEGVGATGPKLRFEDGRIQSAGTQFGSGAIRNRYRLAEADEPGDSAELLVSRETSGVTGACLAVRKTVFEEVGGFAESFPMNYNDVDFALKMLRHGHRLLWLHDVELFHFESVTRDRTVHPWELTRLAHRWGDRKVVKERYASGVR